MSEHSPGYAPDEPQEPSAPTVDVRALRAAAEAATPGPWMVLSRGGNGGTSDYAYGWDVEGPPEPHVRGQYANRADAAFIAAFHPATALALLDRLEMLEAALERFADEANWHVFQPPFGPDDAPVVGIWRQGQPWSVAQQALAALGREEAGE